MAEVDGNIDQVID